MAVLGPALPTAPPAARGAALSLPLTPPSDAAGSAPGACSVRP